MSRKQQVATIATFGAWTSLGFYRGMRQYEHDRGNFNSITENIKPVVYSNQIVQFSHRVMNGVLGMFIYANPICWIVIIPKELYRLEVNVRNMKSEKKRDYYHEIF